MKQTIETLGHGKSKKSDIITDKNKVIEVSNRISRESELVKKSELAKNKEPEKVNTIAHPIQYLATDFIKINNTDVCITKSLVQDTRGKTWHQSLDILFDQHMYMPSLAEFTQYLCQLKDVYFTKSKLYYADGHETTNNDDANLMNLMGFSGSESDLRVKCYLDMIMQKTKPTQHTELRISEVIADHRRLPNPTSMSLHQYRSDTFLTKYLSKEGYVNFDFSKIGIPESYYRNNSNHQPFDSLYYRPPPINITSMATFYYGIYGMTLDFHLQLLRVPSRGSFGCIKEKELQALLEKQK